MTKVELIAAVANDANLTKKDAEAAVNSALNAITAALKDGDKVTLVGFGTFEVRERPERKGRNPQTGAEITIEASKLPAFKAGKALIASINPNPAFTTVVAGKANNGNGGNEPTGRDRIIENINREKN